MANISRKDSKGRKLKDGETERKDGRYVYRYTDKKTGKRKSIYARDLADLREKENEVHTSYDNMMDDSLTKNLTVNDLIGRYLQVRQISDSTKVNYLSIWNTHIKKSIGEYKVKQLVSSDIKKFFTLLANDGYSYGVIKYVHNLLRPALELAVDDGIINRNPAKMNLSGYGKTPKEMTALTEKQQEQLLNFVKSDSVYNCYYPMLTIMLNTGLRCGELCGLTLNDVDMENRIINVNHQLIYKNYGDGVRFHVSTPKTTAGIRKIPMTEKVFQAFEEQKKLNSLLGKDGKQFSLEGYTDFIFLTRNGRPLLMSSVNKILDHIVNAMNGQDKDTEPFPHISAHVMRHTFCTRMAENNVNVKAMQYIMGHANVNITMQIYTHISDREKLANELEKIGSLTEF